MSFERLKIRFFARLQFIGLGILEYRKNSGDMKGSSILGVLLVKALIFAKNKISENFREILKFENNFKTFCS